MAWELADDNSDNIISILGRQGTLPQGEKGELASFRIDPRIMRRISEILEQRQILSIKTKSDLYRASIDYFLRYLVEQGMLNPETSASVDMYMIQRKIERQNEMDSEVQQFLDNMIKRILKARLDGDDEALTLLRRDAITFCNHFNKQSFTNQIMSQFPNE